MKNNVKNLSTIILDCTLRDGGYYNNWDFGSDVVERYLRSMQAASVDVIEIGFRSLPKSSFMGPFLYSMDDYLEKLPLPRKALIGVMINAKEYLESANKPKGLINMLFQPAESSPVGLVRIAINFEKALEAKPLTNELKKLGYKVGLNMMQSHGKKKEQYEQMARQITKWGSVDVLYFADSLGNMHPADVSFIGSALQKYWTGHLGFHAHNNKGLALINSLTAFEEGITWCDSTIMGMGRGAGNTPTEALLMECSSGIFRSRNTQVLASCLKRFESLKQEYQWGPNLHYHFAAENNIHPTFVQFLLDKPNYKSGEAFAALESLAKKLSSSYSDNTLREVLYQTKNNETTGTWDATGWLEGRDVLLIGQGPSVKKYKNAIENYIQKHKPAVLFVNINPILSNKLGDGTILSYESWSIFNLKRYKKLGHPVIMPASQLISHYGSGLEDLNIYDYGLILQDDSFDFGPNECFLQWPLTSAYALAVVTQAKANKIFLVGFDGFDSNDPAQVEMNEVLATYNRLQNCLPLKSLTPTSYPIPQGSIFEPVIQLNDFIIIIPARYNSSRFPGKPLADLSGKSLIRRVWDRCVQAVGTEQVLVATDDEKIQTHCLEQGIQVMMTSNKCLTGTDRVYEVALQLERDFYINVQGDEPLIEPNDILAVIEKARRNKGEIINCMCSIEDEQDFRSTDVPKVVTSPEGRLLYISRAPIPTGKKHEFKEAMRQVCIYAFPKKAILEFGRQSEKTRVEGIEDIEILRFLEMGHLVRMIEVGGSAVAVDTPEDLERVRSLIHD
jgi:4-hydroxy 2-oxovalerate aldolase